MYTVFIFVLVVLVAEGNANTYMQELRRSPNINFLRTREPSIRKLDQYRRDQNQQTIQAMRLLRTIPIRLFQSRNQYNAREDGYSRLSLNSFCGTCLKDMWDQRKSSLTCISISEKFIREELFSLYQKIYDLEYGSKEKQCEHQQELKRCVEDSCVDAVVARSEMETRQITEDADKIEKDARILLDKISQDSNACMKGYIQGFEVSNKSCDDNPEQVDDPNRHHDFHPHNDSKMEM